METIDALEERKVLLDRRLEKILKTLNNIQESNEMASNQIEASKDNMTYSFKELIKHDLIKRITVLSVIALGPSYAFTKDDRILFTLIFSIVLFTINQFFLVNEEKKLTEEKFITIVNTFCEKINYQAKDKLLKEKEVVFDELNKINYALDFCNSLTKEEQEKYLKLKL